MNLIEKQSRIAETLNFFNQLYGKIPESHFSYLWTKPHGIFSFAVADLAQREAMAKKAIELANSGVDVWHSVNPVNVAPYGGKRGDENVVSFQTACVTDIDIFGEAHKSNNLAVNFDEAKSFLPFTPSAILDSGHGLQAYFIFDQPILVTDDNREKLKHRNILLLDVIRQRANGKNIDGVGDLPRILRTPGTFNYKLGAENAPMCRVVEDSGLRFFPSALDEKLNALIKIQKTNNATEMPPRKTTEYHNFADNRDFNTFRARRMLDFISPSSLTYDDWLAIGMALKNIGCDCSDWENWSRSDERFKDGECQYKWNGFNRDGYDFGTLFLFAEPNGYNAQETYREWHDLNPNFISSDKKNTDDESTTQIDELKAELRKNAKAFADFDAEKSSALERLKNIETFDSDSVFAEDVLNAAAFAFLFDKKAFSDFRLDIKNFGNKNKDKKVSVNDWLADVKDKAAEIRSHHDDLITQHNEIQAHINSLTFVSAHDVLQGLTFPEGYSVSSKSGVEKVKGESIITVCRRPVIISGKHFDVEEKKYKVILSYMTTTGTWKNLPRATAVSGFLCN